MLGVKAADARGIKGRLRAEGFKVKGFRFKGLGFRFKGLGFRV